jgi:hypothetical protein
MDSGEMDCQKPPLKIAYRPDSSSWGIEIGNSAYSWAQKGVCVESSDIFCMYFLELNFLPVEAPDI